MSFASKTEIKAGDEVMAKRFVSFDGAFSLESKAVRPAGQQFFSERADLAAPAIPRGGGLSYSAASFGRDVLSIEHSLLNNVLEFSEKEQWIVVEAGMTLGQLYDFLIERGLLLATQPGHPNITVGGCIAADIHGKNQYLDGTFINQVLELSLFHPAYGVLRLSRQQNAELFNFTCGGYGLSGNILSAKLKLKKVEFPGAELTLKPVSGIDELIRELNVCAGEADILYSWHDFTCRGKNFGHGFIQAGRFSQAAGSSSGSGKLKSAAAGQTLSSETRGSIPIKVFNKYSVKMMNILFGAKCLKGESKVTLSLFDSMFPIQKSKELYFKFFGPAGFHEYQALLPEDRFAEYIAGIKDFLSKNELPVTLASAKLFAGKRDLLRFSGQGICFALNFPRQREAELFLPYLDDLLLRCSGIPNIIKDSRLPRDVVEAAYPEYSQFKKILHEFDPERIYRSELSSRLGL